MDKRIPIWQVTDNGITPSEVPAGVDLWEGEFKDWEAAVNFAIEALCNRVKELEEKLGAK